MFTTSDHCPFIYFVMSCSFRGVFVVGCGTLELLEMFMLSAHVGKMVSRERNS